MSVVYIIPLLIVSILAFWKEHAAMFMIVCGVAVMTGLYCPDMIGTYPELGISIGLSIIAFGLLCAGWSFRLMFWSEK